MSLLKKCLQCLFHDWMFDQRPDANHVHRRRFTRSYLRKRQIVKSMWIVSGLAVLLQGANPAFAAVMFLATLFAAFCILDES